MNAYRMSCWKTIVAAAAVGVMAFVTALAIQLGGWFAAAPWWMGLLQPALVAGAAMVGIAALLVVAGGCIVVYRDVLQASGRTDLFTRLNRSKSEAALMNNPKRGAHIWRSPAGAWLPHVGDLVEIKSLEEITATLDDSGSLDGLPFMAEMAQFCGRRARVFRRVDKIYDYGRTKKMRRLDDAVSLVQMRCDGSAHDGCQAACYIIWKTQWLRPVAARRTQASPSLGEPASAACATCTARLPPAKCSDAEGGTVRYRCQYTELAAASTPMKSWDLRQDLRPLLAGNITFAAFCVAMLTRLFNKVQGARGGCGFPYRERGHCAKTPSVNLGLEPGKSVRVLPADRIWPTLTPNGHNRGLWFDADMLKRASQSHTVLMRVERIIDDASGRMLEMKSPCIVLDDVYSTGEYLRFSAQHDYLYWREIWLDPLPGRGEDGQRAGLQSH